MASEAGVNLARSRDWYTEQLVFNTQMIAALMLGMESGASAQPATNDHGPRADYSATTGVEHRAGKLAYFDQIASDRASYRDVVVTLAEMTAAVVIK